VAAEGGGVMTVTVFRDEVDNPGLVLVRGAVVRPDGRLGVAIVPVPADVPYIEAVARPLLAAEFAAGRWYDPSSPSAPRYVRWVYADPAREPLAVGPGPAKGVG